MTKEELKQEAEEYTKNLLKKLGIKEDMLLENQPKYLRLENMNFVALTVENVTDAYLASAEPREKRIEELEWQLQEVIKDKDYFSDALDKQIEATLKLHKENEEKEKRIAEQKEINEDLKQSLDWANERESEDFKRIAELEAQIEKMKCCENCKYNSYWGNELHCNYGLKEALQEDKLVECKNMDKWELKEND